MPFINVRIVGENLADDPKGKKAKITKGIVAAITSTLPHLTEKDVWVVIDSVPARDWFVGNTDVETMRAKAK